MQIEISKTDYANMMTLVERVVDAIYAHPTSIREYNYARRLRLVKRKIERRNAGQD